MAQITRRGIFGLAGGAVGLAACATTEVSDALPVFSGEVSFDHGVASGDPLQTAVILWTRVTPKTGTGPITVLWEVFSGAEGDTLVSSGRMITDASRDYTIKIDADGLSPATEYTYRFSVAGANGTVVSPTGRTRTLAATGDAPVKAAVISCSNFLFGYFHVYDAISKQEDLDVVIHLGDYLYEYGNDGYGSETGAAMGRQHAPDKEIVSLSDYRTRHAQYKADPALQAAHAAAPWICTWDDHESANDAYRTGAENHDASEGDWTTRKQRAVQAYLEWMPVRDPAPGAARAALWRRFDFGDVMSMMCLETRLTGRSEEIAWGAELGSVEDPSDFPAKAQEVMARVNNPTRTMLGAEQEAWLAGELESSVVSGKPWQVLANQIIMAEVRPPNFSKTLTAEQAAAITSPFLSGLIGFSQLRQPLNLDAWDGFPAARTRLYKDAKAAGANLVTLTGDTHTAWANTLADADGEARGVEFGCTSVTSPGLGTYLPGVDDLGQQFSDANPQVTWHDPQGNGFTVLEVSKEAARAKFYKVSDVTKPTYGLDMVSAFEALREAPGTLKRV